jgi:hypothetical protein
LYVKEYQRLFNKKPTNEKGFLSWAAYYKSEKLPFLLEYLNRSYTIDHPELVLNKIVPDFIFPHFFILHESGDLYKIYKRIKDFGYNTKSLMRDIYELKSSVRFTFIKIITKLIENYPSIFKDSNGTLSQTLTIKAIKASQISGIENIGDVTIEKRKDGSYLVKITKVDQTIVDYINRYYDILVKRMPLYNIAEVFKKEGFKNKIL